MPACGFSVTEPDAGTRHVAWQVDVESNYGNFGPTAPLEIRIVFPSDFPEIMIQFVTGNYYDWHGQWIQVPEYGLSPGIVHAGDTIFLPFIPGTAYSFGVEARQRVENGGLSGVTRCGSTAGGSALDAGLSMEPVKFRAFDS